VTGIWFTRRAVALHLTVLVVVPTFLFLGWWQFTRATSGNDLSWAYTFEWPIFAAYAVFMWWKLVHEWPSSDPDAEAEPPPGLGSALPDDIRAEIAEESGRVDTMVGAAGPSRAPRRRGGAPGGPADGNDAEDQEDEELRAYNEYLSALNASDRKRTW
jgi:hypothetical protein